jgi:formylglycine-generating enzyme required for sulfatase activity
LGVKFVRAGTDGVLFSVWDVRVKDYVAFLDANPGYNAGGWWYHSGIQPLGFAHPDFAQTPECPAVMVSWDDAHAFCAWLTKKEQAEGRLRPDQEYRLPTDAEWSKAVGLNESSGATPKDKDRKITNIYPWGTQWPPPAGAGNFRGEEDKSKYPGPIAGYNDGNVDTSPVGSFIANQYGLYDMAGNVWQWCEDKWSPPYDFLVLRGGSFVENSPDGLLSMARHDSEAFDRTRVSGFRCVIVVSRQKRGTALDKQPGGEIRAGWNRWCPVQRLGRARERF